MGSIWAMARHTFAQCLRMRIAVVFIILLAVILGMLPVRMEGDGTLAGKIRVFLSYGLSATQILLILVTIFVATSVVSSDVRAKLIFTIATKPITRSQYIIGRWLGVVLLNALLLGLAAAATFAVAQYLRAGQAVSARDVQAIEAEVFSARHQASPKPPPIDQKVNQRIAAMEADGRLARAVEDFMASTGGDRDAALAQFRQEIHKQETEKFQSIGPGQTRLWRFSGIDVQGQQVGTVGVVDQFVSPAARIRVDPKIIGQLVSSGPVQIDGVAAEVVVLGRDFFDARLDEGELQQQGRSGFEPDQRVRILIIPAIQLTYKITPATFDVPGNALKSRWAVVNPADPNIRYVLPSRDDPVNMTKTLTIPARVVGQDGRVDVVYRNLPNLPANFATSVRIRDEDISLLYRAGGFTGNFTRGVLLILLQLMFIAAVGVLAGSFTSFPVACLICFAVLPFAFAGDFLTQAVRLSRGTGGTEFSIVVGHYILQMMRLVLPNMSGMSPGRWLVGGIYIPWGWPIERGLPAAVDGPPSFLPAVGMMLLVRTLVVLGLACLIFRKRELAKVQE